MLIVEDFNLNLLQGYASSLKEMLKQTMLSQEVQFRKQVHELHCLYWKQQTLMKDSGLKELDGYNLWTVSAQSTLGLFGDPLQYSLMQKEKTNTRSPMLGSTPSGNKNFLEKNHCDYSNLQQRPFDLQLPAYQHVNRVGKDLLERRNGWDLRKSVGSNHHFYNDNVSFPEEVKLTLSIGGDLRKRANGKSTWYDKITHSSSHHVINLEESTDTVSNDDSESISTPSVAARVTGDNYDLRVPVSRNSTKKDLSHGLPSSAHVDVSESYEGQSSFNPGFKGQHNEAFKFDLNRVQLDDSSYLNDPVVACLSTDGSSGAYDGLMSKLFEGTCPTETSWREPNVNCFNDLPTVLQQDAAADHALMVSDSKNSSSKVWASGASFMGSSQTEPCPIDLESMTGTLSEICEDLNSDRMNFESGNTDLPSKFPEGNHTDVTMKEVIETPEEGSMCPHPCRNGSRVEDANSYKSPSSCKFDCIAEDSSSGAKTMQSETDFEGSNTSTFNQFSKSQSSQVAEIRSVELELRSSNSSELKHQCCDKKQEKSAGEDVLIQKAAESLIHFSLGVQQVIKHSCIKTGSNGIENEWRDKPQHSLDSYESLVLKLTESSEGDYCVSSKLFEVNEPDKKDCGIKLRRGRRLKDFRRDILPGLASLSRHEIREDVNIMESVIRSREYKRMRSKTAGGGNWFAPVKSRRSRLNYVGRRYYS